MKKLGFVVLTFLVLSIIAVVGVVKYKQNKSASAASEKNSPIAYTLEEVSKHNSETDCWVAVNNSVYDITTFIPDHPGGKYILDGCGKEATGLFDSVAEHKTDSRNASGILETYKIGYLK